MSRSRTQQQVWRELLIMGRLRMRGEPATTAEIQGDLWEEAFWRPELGRVTIDIIQRDVKRMVEAGKLVRVGRRFRWGGGPTYALTSEGRREYEGKVKVQDAG